MDLEIEIYQVLKNNKLSLKKREYVIDDLLDLIKKDRAEQLILSSVVQRSELLDCEHRWIHNTHDKSKYCSRGCDGFIKHEAI